MGLKRLISECRTELGEAKRKASRKVRRADIRNWFTFKYDGKQVVAKVVGTQWSGGTQMTYNWQTKDGRTKFSTDGIPVDAEIAEV